MDKQRLNVDLFGLQLDNPTILASGILGYSSASLESVVEGGAGAVVTKSIGAEPRRGYSNPTVVQVDCGLVNAMGLPNPGVGEFIRELREMKCNIGVPIIVSVFGYSVEEYAKVAERAIGAGADAVELNVSCPHVKETGSEIGQDPEMVAKIVRRVKRAVTRPVVVKLSPNAASVAEIAEVAQKAGADAVTAANTVRAMAIDAETALPILSNRVGGLSGRAVKPIALRCVYELYEQVKVPIIGCGGISEWRDAVEFLLAGASAVQVGTAIAEKGPGVFRSINRGIDSFLKRKGLRSVREIVGQAHRK